jgi:hypothetical protein
VLPLKFVSPLYTAVIECEPTVNADVLKVAEPELKVPVPKVVVPSLKVTVPVGVLLPDVGVTVAVKVTLWPKTEGFAEDTTAVVVVIMTEFTV